MELTELFRLLGEIPALWNVREFYRLKNNLRAAILLGGLIFLGAFLGAINMEFKIVFLEFSIIAIMFFLIRIAINRGAYGIEITSAIEKAKASKPELKNVLVSGAECYIKLVAAILASEITIGLLAIWLPAHKNPAMAMLILIAAASLICYAIWRGGKSYWHKIVLAVAIETIIAAALFIFMPNATTTAEKWIGGMDNKIACKIDPSRNGCQQPQATALATKKIVWVLDQTITIPSNEWVELPIKFDGKGHKFAPDTKSAGIEFVADERYGTTNAYGQFDFGEIQKSLKARSLKGDAVIYMYTASPS